MIMFWVFAVAMVIASLIFLLRPFFLEMKKDEIERSTLNVNITKERLAELETELALDTITQAEYEQTREELEQALLFDIEQVQEEKAIKQVNTNTYNRYTRTSLLLSVPVLAISFYLYLGQPELVEGVKKQAVASTGSNTSLTIEQMVNKLAQKMKEKPDNAEGWFMLGRSYMSLNRYKEAAVALEKANKLLPNNAVIMLRYADALTMSQGGRITGKPFELIKLANTIDPKNTTGLWLLGMGYEEKSEYRKAISYWVQLVPLLSDNKSIDEVQNLIRQARNKAGISVSESSLAKASSPKNKSMTSLSLKVSIDQSVLKHVSLDDTVFIFAKAVNGPPMPLAVARKKVKDLPLVVTLDDTMAMISSMKISNFTNVQVSARVSKSGQPRAQSGDVQSDPRIVESSQKEIIELMINKMVP